MLELVAFAALGLGLGDSPYAKAPVVVSQPDSVLRQWRELEDRAVRLEKSIRLQLPHARLGDKDPIIQQWKWQLEVTRKEQKEIQRRVRPR
jgi:hypothetical protein